MSTAVDQAVGAAQRGRRSAAARVGAAPRTRSAMVLLVVAYSVFFVLPGDIALVGPLRSNGTPLRLLGLVAFVLVVAGFLRLDQRRRPRPVALVVVGYLAVVLLGWATANTHALTPAESAQIDRSVLITVSGAGVALLAAYVVRTRREAHLLAGCLTVGAVVTVVVGILQFVGVLDVWADVIATPFTTTVVGPMGVVSRLGFNRVPGTTSSPLEYSVVLAVVLPLVVHLALHAGSRAARGAAAAAAVLVLVGLPLGFSRSGLITLVVVLVVLLPFLRGAQRVAVAASALLGTAVAVVLAPQVIQVFSDLVLGAEEDNSIQGRLQDYPAVWAQFADSPWIGNGPGFERSLSSVLDNQWLGTLVRDGLVGVAGLLLLLLGGALLAAWSAGRHPAGSPGRSLDGALCAGLVGLAVAAGTFDILSFQQATFAAFLLLGLVGVAPGPAGAEATAELTDEPATDGPTTTTREAL